MSPEYNNPRDYLLSGDHTSLIVPGFPLGDLERAIVGFIVSSPPLTRRNAELQNTVSYNTLRELIFEYYKINNQEFFPRDLPIADNHSISYNNTAGTLITFNITEISPHPSPLQGYDILIGYVSINNEITSDLIIDIDLYYPWYFN